MAAACLDGVSAAGPRKRALAAGFAASAHSDEQLAVARAWLSGRSRPDGLTVDGELRGRLLQTLARALYPATLVEDAKLTATTAALEHGALSQALRLVVQEQEAILRSVLAGRSVLPRYSWLLVVTRRYSSRAAASAGTSTE